MNKTPICSISQVSNKRKWLKLTCKLYINVYGLFVTIVANIITIIIITTTSWKFT